MAKPKRYIIVEEVSDNGTGCGAYIIGTILVLALLYALCGKCSSGNADRTNSIHNDSTSTSGEIEFGHISFNQGSDIISSSSYPNLDDVVSYMHTYESVTLQIYGHTDSAGDSLLNLELSEDRANSVADYLVQHGVARDRLEVLGCGELYPIADNSTSEGRELNRRITFTAL